MNYKHSIDFIFLGVALLHFVAMIYTFAFLGHYVLPSILFINGVLVGHLAYFGLHHSKLAKYLMFWLVVALCVHLLFALFYAITPPKILGSYFTPVYGTALLVFSFIAWQYSKANTLMNNIRFQSE